MRANKRALYKQSILIPQVYHELQSYELRPMLTEKSQLHKSAKSLFQNRKGGAMPKKSTTSIEETMFNRRLGFLNGSTSATTKHKSLFKDRVEKIRYVD